MDLRLLSQGHLQSARSTACDSYYICPVCMTLMMDDQLPGSAPRLLAWLTRATRRGRDAQVHALGLENSRDAVPMSVFWLVPQYAIIGAAEILVNIGARTSARRHGYGRVRAGLGGARRSQSRQRLRRAAGGLACAPGAVEVGGGIGLLRHARRLRPGMHVASMPQGACASRRSIASAYTGAGRASTCYLPVLDKARP